MNEMNHTELLQVPQNGLTTVPGETGYHPVFPIEKTNPSPMTVTREDGTVLSHTVSRFGETLTFSVPIPREWEVLGGRMRLYRDDDGAVLWLEMTEGDDSVWAVTVSVIIWRNTIKRDGIGSFLKNYINPMNIVSEVARRKLRSVPVTGRAD